MSQHINMEMINKISDINFINREELIDVIKKKNDEPSQIISLFAGQGFSLANPQYNTSNTYSKIDFPKLITKNVLNKNLTPLSANVLDSYGYEAALEHIDNAIKLIPSQNKNLIDDLREERKQIVFSVAEEIMMLHPKNIQEGIPPQSTDDTYSNCAAFLSQFDSLYTTNYDLLIYLVLNKNEDQFNGQRLRKQLGDGFSTNVWGTAKNNHSKTQSFFLNGALQFYTNESNSYMHKHLAKNLEGKLLYDVIKSNSDTTNIAIISGGSSSFKKHTIEANQYYRYCHNNLQSTKSDLIIYGSSIGYDNKHIWERINANPGIQKVYIGYYDEKHKNNILMNAFNFFSNKHVYLYDSSKINPWKEKI